MERRAAAADGRQLALARVLAPVTTLGPGRRVGIWTQGCALACPGCASRDTWDPDAGTIVGAGELAYTLQTLLTDAPDGITLTGGEPTDQAAALVEALTRLTPLPDLLLFTGRTHAAAQAVAPALLDLATCVVAGPYRPDQPPAESLRRLVASGNQTLHFSDTAAEARYRAWAAGPGPDLQVLADDRDLFLVGLPRAGDLEKFRKRMAERGVEMGGMTWRA